MDDFPQYEPISTNGAPGTWEPASQPAWNSARPSSGGMKPFTDSASSRRAGCTAGYGTHNRPGSPHAPRAERGAGVARPAEPAPDHAGEGRTDGLARPRRR